MNIPIKQEPINRPTRLRVFLETGWSQIERACAEAWGIEPHRLYEKRHYHHIVHPRMLAMFLLREREGWTYSQIKEHFGLMDHGTALHACKAIKEWTETDKRFAAKRQAVERAL